MTKNRSEWIMHTIKGTWYSDGYIQDAEITPDGKYLRDAQNRAPFEFNADENELRSDFCCSVFSPRAGELGRIGFRVFK